MEITSPPATETLRVTDLDVRFPDETYSGTLYPADTLTVSEHESQIQFSQIGREDHKLRINRLDEAGCIPIVRTLMGGDQHV